MTAFPERCFALYQTGYVDEEAIVAGCRALEPSILGEPWAMDRIVVRPHWIGDFRSRAAQRGARELFGRCDQAARPIEYAPR